MQLRCDLDFQQQQQGHQPMVLNLKKTKGLVESFSPKLDDGSTTQKLTSALAPGPFIEPFPHGYPRTKSLSFQSQPWRWFNACTLQLATKGGEEGGFRSRTNQEHA